MPTISTISAGSIAAYGTIRIADKNVTTITDVEIIHDYSGSNPIPTDGRLYVTRVVGSNRQNHNTYDYLTFYYTSSLTTALTNCIVKIKGERYFFADQTGVISELLPSLGWDNYRYTADWEGVDIDNPAWLGEVSNNPDWTGVKFLYLSWQGVVTNTENWIGELVDNPNWTAPMIDNPSPTWVAPLINNDNWQGVLVDSSDLNWVDPLINNPAWVQTYYDNPFWTAQLINNPAWVQTYYDNPNWTAQLINNPDPNWEDPVINNPNWSGEAIYDEYYNVIGYDTSNPQLSNGGLVYEGRTEGNLGLIYETRNVDNQGLLPDDRTEGNLGLIYETRNVDNQGLLPDDRTEGNLGLIREGRTEANLGLVRDLSVTRTEGNGGLIREGRTEANLGLIPEGRTEANLGRIRDTSYPNITNGGQYYDPLVPRTVENGGFTISYADEFRSKENGGLLYDLTVTRTLANNGIIHSIAGEYRTVENGGLVHLDRTIENGAFVSAWVPWVLSQEGSEISTYFTRSNDLVGNKLYNYKSIGYGVYNGNFSSSIFANLHTGPDRFIYNKVSPTYFIGGGFSLETYYASDSWSMSSTSLSKATIGDTLLNGNFPYKKVGEDYGVVFFGGTKLDPLSVHSNILNAVGGSYERYTTNSSGVINGSTRFDGEYWYSFGSIYAEVLKSGSSYTIELFVKPDMANASLFNFVPPYSSPEIAREAEMGIISLSYGIDADTKWILSIAPDLHNNSNYFKLIKKTAQADELIIMPAQYTEGDTWQHIAITYTAQTNTLSFYLNGTLICKTFQPTPTTMSISATLDIGVRETIGSAKSGVFNGRIKDLRIATKNIYATGETTGQITVPDRTLQYWGYGWDSNWSFGDTIQDLQQEDVALLTLRLNNFLGPDKAPMAPQGAAYSNRPSIKNVKIVGLYAEKVLIEYELSSHKLITKTHIALQKNNPEPIEIYPEEYLEAYVEESYQLLNTATVYPGDSENVVVLEELTVVPEKLYHFSIIVASSAGTAQSNIYSFKTPSL